MSKTVFQLGKKHTRYWYLNFVIISNKSVIKHFDSKSISNTLTDVTLVFGDGKLLETHKIILCIGSTFFDNIFKTTPNSDIVIMAFLSILINSQISLT